MELRENMYIRYVPTLGEYTQKISKITNIKNCMLDMCYTLDNKEKVFSSHFDEIIKASDKPIDLVEAGDYVNGVEVENIDEEWITMSDTKMPILKSIANGLIVSIVTKEQFDQMFYKVGE